MPLSLDAEPPPGAANPREGTHGNGVEEATAGANDPRPEEDGPGSDRKNPRAAECASGSPSTAAGRAAAAAAPASPVNRASMMKLLLL